MLKSKRKLKLALSSSLLIIGLVILLTGCLAGDTTPYYSPLDESTEITNNIITVTGNGSYKVIPDINLSASTKNTIAVGINTITAPANIEPQSLVYCNDVWRWYNPSAIVFLLGSVVKIRATIYSFHNPIKLKIAPVRIPGAAIGSIILKNVLNSLQPSMKAASSSSDGIVKKNPVNKNIVKGKLHAT